VATLLTAVIVVLAGARWRPPYRWPRAWGFAFARGDTLAARPGYPIASVGMALTERVYAVPT
jgi:hypothetical protein